MSQVLSRDKIAQATSNSAYLHLEEETPAWQDVTQIQPTAYVPHLTPKHTAGKRIKGANYMRCPKIYGASGNPLASSHCAYKVHATSLPLLFSLTSNTRCGCRI